MPRKLSTFRYSLEALLKHRRWEQDSSALKERTARDVLSTRTQDARIAAAAVSGVESALRDSLKAGTLIDPRRHESLALYLTHARQALWAKARQVSNAEEAHEQTQRGLLQSVRAVRALERHKDDKQREFKRERGQIEQRKLDDLWLAGHPGPRNKRRDT
jgi:flagellar biosynthesis chaperone FliJ